MFGSTVVFTAILFFSCHLEDFNMDKLAVAKDIRPVFYAPLAYGSYKIGDHLTTPYLDNDTVKVTEIDIDRITYDKSGVSFKSNAIDSVYLVVNFTNGTPMKMQFLFDFINTGTGVVYGKIFDSGVMDAGKMDATGKVIQPASTRIEFLMDSNDLNNITLANGMEFNVKLFLPDSGSVIVKNLKASLLKVEIAIRAPVSYWKL